MTSSQLGIILKRLENLETLMIQKENTLLSLNRAALYMDVSRSFLYKLTSERKLPYHKPCAKLVYFRTFDLDAYVLQNRVSTEEEIEQAATRHVNGRRLSS